MAMPNFVNEIDIQEFKEQRANGRKVKISRKRLAYEDSLAKRTLLSQVGTDCKGLSGHDQAKPHRTARAALRTFLAREAIETESDVPSISMGRPGCRKPSVSPLLTCQDRPMHDVPVWDELSLEKQQDSDLEPMLHADDCDTTATEGEDNIKDHSKHDCSEGTSSQEATSCESSDSEVNIKATASPCPTEQGNETQHEPLPVDLCEHRTKSSEDEVSDKEKSGAARREAILREVAVKLHRRAREAEQAAAEAQGRADECQSLTFEKTGDLKCSRKDIKRALQLEKQRAAEIRKKRNQAAHVQAMKDKAARTLQEADRIREQAEADAVAVQAQLLARASETAQLEAEMRAKEEILKAEMEAAALKEEGFKAKAEMEAHMQSELMALKSGAERDIQRMKQIANEEVKAQAQAIVQAAHATAEEEARAVRERAFAHVCALKARVEAEMLKKADAHERATRAAVEQARADAEAKVRKEEESRVLAEVEKLKIQKKREDTIGLKQAKELAKQQAQKFRKQMQIERQLEEEKQQEFDRIRAQAMQDAENAKECALAEAAKLKAQALADASTIRARAASEAQAKAGAEAAKRLEAAEAEAQAIKTKAEQEAQQIQSQLEKQLMEAQVQLKILRVQEDAQSTDMSGPHATAPEVDDKVSHDEWEVLPTMMLQPVLDTCDWDLVA